MFILALRDAFLQVLLRPCAVCCFNNLPYGRSAGMLMMNFFNVIAIRVDRFIPIFSHQGLKT